MTCTATNYGTGLIPQLLGNVDTAGCNYVQGAYQALSRPSDRGRLRNFGRLVDFDPLRDLLGLRRLVGNGDRLGHRRGVPTVSRIRDLHAGDLMERFREFRIHALQHRPLGDRQSLLSAGGTTTYTSPNAMVTALENIWNQISQAYQAHVAFSLFSLGAYIVGIACVVIIALFLAVATFTIILSKVFLWLLLGIAPLIILTLLFNASSRFFSGWLNSVVQYAVLQMLVYAFLAFYLTVTQSVFANLATTMSSGSVDWSALAPFVLIGLTGTFLLTQLPALAASISGGMPMWGLTVGGLWRGILRPPGTAALANARIPFVGWRGLNRSIADRQAAARVKRIYGDAGARALQDRLMKQ